MKPFSPFVIFLMIFTSGTPAVGAGGENGRSWSFSQSLISYLEYLDYNRVDGAFAGTKVSLFHGGMERTTLTGAVGFAFSAREWRYSISLAHSFDPLNYKAVSLSFFDETRTHDDSRIISHFENILSAAIPGRDYRDYFRVRGVESQADYRFNENLGITVGFGVRSYTSLPNRQPWSLFSGKEGFRDNPRIAENSETLLVSRFRFTSMENFFIEANYWQLEAAFEREFDDFDFSGVHFLIQRKQLSFSNQTITASLQGGFRNGTTAEQYLMDLGGIGTLPGYDFKEFTGNRRILFEIDYLFNGDILQKLPLQAVPFYSSLETGVFFDAGLAWIRNTDKHLLSMDTVPSGSIETGSRFRDIKSDAGVSLYFVDGVFKIDIARRLDRNRDPWKYTFRIRLFNFS